METLFTNGTHQRLKKIDINNTVSIPQGKEIHCQTCFIELVRPCEKTKDIYESFNNSISLNRCIIFPHAPNFFCKNCWNETLAPNILNLILGNKKNDIIH